MYGSPHAYANNNMFDLTLGHHTLFNDKNTLSVDFETGYSLAESHSDFSYISQSQNVTLNTTLKNTAWFALSIRPGLVLTNEIALSLSTSFIRTYFMTHYKYHLENQKRDKINHHASNGMRYGIALKHPLK